MHVHWIHSSKEVAEVATGDEEEVAVGAKQGDKGVGLRGRDLVLGEGETEVKAKGLEPGQVGWCDRGWSCGEVMELASDGRVDRIWG